MNITSTILVQNRYISHTKTGGMAGSIFCRALLSKCQNGRESCDKRSRTSTLIIESTIIRIVNIQKLTLVDAFA